MVERGQETLLDLVEQVQLHHKQGWHTTVTDNNSGDGDDGTDTLTNVEFLYLMIQIRLAKSLVT